MGKGEDRGDDIGLRPDLVPPRCPGSGRKGDGRTLELFPVSPEVQGSTYNPATLVPKKADTVLHYGLFWTFKNLLSPADPACRTPS